MSSTGPNLGKPPMPCKRWNSFGKKSGMLRCSTLPCGQERLGSPKGTKGRMAQSPGSGAECSPGRPICRPCPEGGRRRLHDEGERSRGAGESHTQDPGRGRYVSPALAEKLALGVTKDLTRTPHETLSDASMKSCPVSPRERRYGNRRRTVTQRKNDQHLSLPGPGKTQRQE